MIQAPSGRITTFTYDAQGRVATQSDSLSTRTVTYDAADNVRTVQEGTAMNTRTYDTRHRVARSTDPRGRIVQYSYDLHGNLTQLTYAAAGQLLQVEERDAEGVLLAAVPLAYDRDGFPRQRLVLPVPPTLAVSSTTMTVDADNRVTTVNNAAVTHDADGQRTAGPLPSGAPAGYTFDTRHRLQSVLSLCPLATP